MAHPGDGGDGGGVDVSSALSFTTPVSDAPLSFSPPDSAVVAPCSPPPGPAAPLAAPPPVALSVAATGASTLRSACRSSPEPDSMPVSLPGRYARSPLSARAIFASRPSSISTPASSSPLDQPTQKIIIVNNRVAKVFDFGCAYDLGGGVLDAGMLVCVDDWNRVNVGGVQENARVVGLGRQNTGLAPIEFAHGVRRRQREKAAKTGEKQPVAEMKLWLWL